MIYNKLSNLKIELINQLNKLNKEELNKFINIVDTKIERKNNNGRFCSPVLELQGEN